MLKSQMRDFYNNVIYLNERYNIDYNEISKFTHININKLRKMSETVNELSKEEISSLIDYYNFFINKEKNSIGNVQEQILPLNYDEIFYPNIDKFLAERRLRIFSRNLCNAFKIKGVSPRAFSIEYKFSAKTIYDFIHCQRMPPMKSLIRIAALLDTNIDSLLSEDKNSCNNRIMKIVADCPHDKMQELVTFTEKMANAFSEDFQLQLWK